jgi:hypothetical protein
MDLVDKALEPLAFGIEHVAAKQSELVITTARVIEFGRVRN